MYYQNIRLQQNNDPEHTSSRTDNWLKREKADQLILKLPARSPNLNSLDKAEICHCNKDCKLKTARILNNGRNYQQTVARSF